MGMRQITLDGRIGKDGAKLMKTNNGKSYIRFSLANDSFINGTNKTEWFDISCFDPFIIDKKSEYMKQGRYAIVQGVINSEVTSKNGKIYLNHYVTANNIELPSVGNRKEEGSEVQVSTYTGGTKPEQTVQTTTQREEQPSFSAANQSPAGWDNDDDLPF